MKTLTKKKKVIILSVMVALLLVTGYVNVALNSSLSSSKTNAQAASASAANFYTTFRSEREATRAQEMQFYDAIITSETSTDEAKTDAQNKKMNLVSQMEKELVTEGVIRGKGFNDAIVTSSSDNVNIFVKASELTSQEVAQITSVATQQLGVEIDKIIIIPSE